MKKYFTSLETLLNEGISEIRTIIQIKGTESKHSIVKSLEITSESVQFNLDGDRWLDEITENGLIDNYGYSYGFFRLTSDQLVLLFDDIVNTYGKK